MNEYYYNKSIYWWIFQLGKVNKIIYNNESNYFVKCIIVYLVQLFVIG